jgi:CRP/FNR family transcriptional regulator, nitrogen oxide reductase regulator
MTAARTPKPEPHPGPGRPPSPVPIFEGLPETVASAVLSAATLRTFHPGMVLCRQGDQARSMFLLRSGKVRFVRATEAGDAVIMRWLAPGDCFGIGSLLAGPVAYMGTAEAVDDGRVYQWDGRTFQAAAARHPRLAQNALTIVLRYFKDYGDRHLALLSATAGQRLARTLTALGSGTGRVLPSGVEIDISNRDLGSLADVSVYTVSRQLQRWEREGHVVKHRQRILLRHPEALLHE